MGDFGATIQVHNNKHTYIHTYSIEVKYRAKMSVKSLLENRKLQSSDCGPYQKVTASTFIKLNKKKGASNKGLGHSVANTNNFDRRNSVATQSTAGRETSYSSVFESLPQESRGNINFQLSEQRCNYERMIIQKRESTSTGHISNSRIQSRCIDFNHVVGELPTDSVGSEFLALREFRMQNTQECFGDRRREHQLHLQVPEIKVTKETKDYQWSCNGRPSSTPYALKQSLLRNELARELTNRRTRLEYLKEGLNKSFALSYQPMYN